MSPRLARRGVSARTEQDYSKRSMPSSGLARRPLSSPDKSLPLPMSSVDSTSTEPVQSSGGSAASMARSAHWLSQSSVSISSTVPSKYWISIVPSSSSNATTSNESPPLWRYHSPILGGGAVMSITRTC